MDETLQRLKDTAAACVKAYEVWGVSKKNAEAREALQEAVHELRKVAARLEIEMAASERDETNQRQIPIPPHRASRARHAELGNELPDFITEGGGANQEDGGESDQQPQPRQGNRPPRLHSGGPRRPQGGGMRRSGPPSQAPGNSQPE